MENKPDSRSLLINAVERRMVKEMEEVRTKMVLPWVLAYLTGPGRAHLDAALPLVLMQVAYTLLEVSSGPKLACSNAMAIPVAFCDATEEQMVQLLREMYQQRTVYQQAQEQHAENGVKEMLERALKQRA